MTCSVENMHSVLRLPRSGLPFPLYKAIHKSIKYHVHFRKLCIKIAHWKSLQNYLRKCLHPYLMLNTKIWFGFKQFSADDGIFQTFEFSTWPSEYPYSRKLLALVAPKEVLFTNVFKCDHASSLWMHLLHYSNAISAINFERWSQNTASPSAFWRWFM